MLIQRHSRVLLTLALSGLLAFMDREVRATEPSPGFQVRPILTEAHSSDAAGVGGVAYTLDGRLVTYVSGALDIHELEGKRRLATFERKDFGSFLVPSPAGDSIFFSENTSYKVFEVSLDGSGERLVDEIRFSYSLAFDPEGRGFVSALAEDFATNSILLLDDDPTTPNPVVAIGLPGVSGPIAFDPAGNLYYGTVILGEDPEKQVLCRFSKEALDLAIAGETLQYADREVLLTELSGFNSMIWHEDALYFTDLGFTTGQGTVQKVDAAHNFLLSEFARFSSDPLLVSPTLLAFRPGSEAFLAGVGPRGGGLVVVSSDYSTEDRVEEITPRLHFLRGAVNGDAEVDISDAIALLGYLFLGEPPPRTPESGDANGDGAMDLTDSVYMLNYLFSGGPTIPAPFPMADYWP